MTDTTTGIPDMEKRTALAQLEAEYKEVRQRHIAEIAALNDKYDAMGIDSADARWIGHGVSSGFVRCAKSGVVLLEEDEVVEDTEAGEAFLRVALGLPPRPVDPDDEADDEAAAEQAA